MSIDIDKLHGAEVTDPVKQWVNAVQPPGLPMLLWCPGCGGRHIDKGEFRTKPHHTHACQHCGMVWRPALVHTVGVQFLPGFKDSKDDL